MNYNDYKKFKEGLDLNKYIRLDCMNPMISLKHLKQNEFYECVKTKNKTFESDKGTLCVINEIAKIFNNRTIYIPKGIYPRYFNLEKIKIKPFFKKIPKIKNQMILLTYNFINHKFNQFDVETLLKDNNIVIIDGVYDFNCELTNYIKHKNLFILRSGSKLQLKKNKLLILHESDLYKDQVVLLDFKQEQIINNDIERRWHLIRSKINNLKIIEQKGYFALSNESFKNLLNKNILGIPYSVFSENNKDINKTVISCIHENFK